MRRLLTSTAWGGMPVIDMYAKCGLYEALVELEREGPRSPYMGICCHVGAYGRNVRSHLLEDLFKRWPKFSGDDEYPVPGVCGLDARECYGSTNGWAGDYGDLRRELLAFCIEELRKEL